MFCFICLFLVEESTQFDEISTIALIQDVTDVDTTAGIEPAEDTETNQTSIEESETAIKYKKQCVYLFKYYNLNWIAIVITFELVNL